MWARLGDADYGVYERMARHEASAKRMKLAMDLGQAELSVLVLKDTWARLGAPRGVEANQAIGV